MRTGRPRLLGLPKPVMLAWSVISSVIGPAAAGVAAAWFIEERLPAQIPGRGYFGIGLAVLVASAGSALAEDSWRVARITGASPVCFLPLRWVMAARAVRRASVCLREVSELGSEQAPRAQELLVRAATHLAARDPFTRGRPARISKLAGELAAYLGFGEQDQEQVKLAGLLLDLGMIGLPETVVSKPSVFDLDDFRAVRAHPVSGAELCREFVDPAVTEAIASHHERPDGLGYPRGARWVSPATRLLTLADTYDALTHDRPYRPALSRQEAFEELASPRCKHLDRTMGRALREMEEERQPRRRFGTTPAGAAWRHARHLLHTSSIPAAAAVALLLAGAITAGQSGAFGG